MSDEPFNDITPGAIAQIGPLYETLRLTIDTSLTEDDLAAIKTCLAEVWKVGVRQGAAEVVGHLRADAIAHGEEPPDIHLDIDLDGGRSPQ